MYNAEDRDTKFPWAMNVGRVYFNETLIEGYVIKAKFNDLHDQEDLKKIELEYFARISCLENRNECGTNRRLEHCSKSNQALKMVRYMVIVLFLDRQKRPIL